MSDVANPAGKSAKRTRKSPVGPVSSNKKNRVPRAGRPAMALITRDAAADAALSLIDEVGLQALNLQGVAKVLGVSAPSLYHHFRDKDALLAKVSRRLLEEVSAEKSSWSTDWEERTTELCVATRHVMLRHPNAASLALRFFPRQMMLPAYENSLIGCPYPPEVQVIVSELVEKFTYGWSLFAAAAKATHVPPSPPVDPAHFPRLAHALAAGPQDEEETFLEALRVLFDGLRSRYGAMPNE